MCERVLAGDKDGLSGDSIRVNSRSTLHLVQMHEAMLRHDVHDALAGRGLKLQHYIPCWYGGRDK